MCQGYLIYICWGLSADWVDFGGDESTEGRSTLVGETPDLENRQVIDSTEPQNASQSFAGRHSSRDKQSSRYTKGHSIENESDTETSSDSDDQMSYDDVPRSASDMRIMTETEEAPSVEEMSVDSSEAAMEQ